MQGSWSMQQILSMGHLISMLGKLSIIMGEVLLIMFGAAAYKVNLFHARLMAISKENLRKSEQM